MTAYGQKIIKVLLGPLLFLLIYFGFEIEGLSDQGRAVLASTAWIGWWWMTEAIAIEATALLPILLFPLLGVLPIKETTFPYAHPLIFLFLGGFIIALAIEKWNLHTRIALNIILLIGSKPSQVVLGFMIATGFLSMWISNTASTLMMLPIGLSVIANLNGDKRFSKSLLLAIAYSASIGGMATLVGTPPNIVFASVVKESLGIEISFGEWMLFGLPFSICMIALTWFVLTKVLYRSGDNQSRDLGIQVKLDNLGRLSAEEKRVLVIFGLVAFSWISREYVLNRFIPALDDTIIAIAGAMLLFIIPDTKGGKLLDWKTTKKIPWGVLLLFGGGLSIANAFIKTDLATWIGNSLNHLQAVPLLLVIVVIVTLVNFLTELTSNVATASMVLPILAALAIAMHIHPYYLMVGAILAASCAFMLPVATPPNAIVFGSGHLTMKDMIRAGVFLNMLSILLITLFVYIIMPLLWDIGITPIFSGIK
ncbi:SLC13 family permease [Reichenbachiella agarivorans]|uniref:SLC13 family permease n=1 Tax=Reichenbachiella agarivorans TaxID=2979464 RepID=A0ABY6CY28_9BACT|nr:SLC13 family permease [Reichenbachiella agarivorans]UXP33120.1 SLC13 family permease [Reichenbachiella agarivorans]